jgi:hypothetical protein
MREAFFKLVNYGASRTVFLIGKFAIKVPKMSEWRCFLNGLLHNMEEANFQKFYAKRGIPVCPVLFAIPGGWANVMPRVPILSQDEWFTLSGEIYDTFIDKHSMNIEMKRDSFGWLNERVVVIDYGDVSWRH